MSALGIRFTRQGHCPAGGAERNPASPAVPRCRCPFLSYRGDPEADRYSHSLDVMARLRDIACHRASPGENHVRLDDQRSTVLQTERCSQAKQKRE